MYRNVFTFSLMFCDGQDDIIMLFDLISLVLLSGFSSFLVTERDSG